LPNRKGKLSIVRNIVRWIFYSVGNSSKAFERCNFG